MIKLVVHNREKLISKDSLFMVKTKVIKNDMYFAEVIKLWI